MIPTLYYVLRHYHSLSPGPPEEYFNHRSQIYVMFFQLLFVFNHKNWIPVVLWRKKLQYVIGPLFFSTHVQPRGHFDLRHVTLYTRNGQEESNSVSLARTRKSVPKEKESGTLVYTWCYSGTPQKKEDLLRILVFRSLSLFRYSGVSGLMCGHWLIWNI